MRQHDYVTAVLAAYNALPDTPSAPRPTDRQTARVLFCRGLPLGTVRAALLLASARRRARCPSAPPLPTVRSLAYFLPVIQEVAQLPLDPAYQRYLATAAARVHIPAFPDER